MRGRVHKTPKSVLLVVANKDVLQRPQEIFQASMKMLPRIISRASCPRWRPWSSNCLYQGSSGGNELRRCDEW